MENILRCDASQNLHNSQSFLTNLKLYSLSDSCHDAYRHLISNYGDTNYMTIQAKNNINFQRFLEFRNTLLKIETPSLPRSDLPKKYI